MAVKPKSSVKSKTASKYKAVKPNKKISSRQSDFSHLAEDIISNISVGICIMQNGKFVHVSPLFQKLSGYSYADLAGTNPLDYIHPDDREVVRKKAIKSLKGKSSDAYEYRFTRKNGEVMWVLDMITSIVFRGKRAALGSFMDITERRQAEEALQKSEERYRNILESIQEGYFELDLAGNYTFVNEANCRFLGYTKEELVGMNSRQHTDEETAKKLYRPYRELYLTGKPIETLEVESIRKDGTKVIYETSVSLIRDSEGKPIGFRGVSRDATERIRHENELTKFLAAMDMSADSIYMVDRSTMRFINVNTTACEKMGYSREELLKMGPQDLLVTDSKELEQMYDEVIASGSAGIRTETFARYKDGRQSVAELHRRALR
jgi:PAS domain S-box-containing protein